MAITYQGSNKIINAAEGTFETDPSGWGLNTTGSNFQVSRVSAEKYEGAHCCKIQCVNSNIYLGFGTFWLAAGVGKFYELSVWVKSSAASPIAPDATIHKIAPSGQYGAKVEIIEQTTATVGEIKTEWKNIYCRFKVTENLLVAMNFRTENLFGENYIPGGLIYIDKATLFEYVVSGDGGGEPGGGDPGGGEPDPEAQPVTDIFFSKNPITTTVVASTQQVAEENFAIKNIVYVGTLYGTDYTEKLPMVLGPDINREAKFFANAAFRNIFSPEPPAYNEAPIKRLTDRIARFQYQYGPISGIELNPVSFSTRGDYLVLLGGLSKEAYATTDFFNTYLKANKNFLTWQPKTKKVDRIQEEYLFFLIWNKDEEYAVPTEVNLKVKVYLRDNTTAESITQTLANPGMGWLMQVPAGFVNSGAISLDPEGQILKYELWLEDQNEVVISEVRTYEVETDTVPYTRYFLFLNSLSGFDTLRTTGLGSKEVAYEREEVELFLPADYDITEGQYKPVNIQSRSRTEISSGFRSKQYVDYLQEMLLSSQVYEITGGRRVPVLIKNQSVTLHTDKKNMWYIRFQIESAFSNTNYTPDI